MFSPFTYDSHTIQLMQQNFRYYKSAAHHGTWILAVLLIDVLSLLTYCSPLQSIEVNQEFKSNISKNKKQSLDDEDILFRSLKEDAELLIPQIIKKYGYPSEVHAVTSDDGYILQIHRIPYGKRGKSSKRPAVLLQHGILASSADWIIAGPRKSLGYILADAGYDVWMLNARGTRYSYTHKTLFPEIDYVKYWDFSWHEIGVYDIAKSIDYILKKVKQKRLFYIGHSQGTTVFYVLCSEKPEYNDKIEAMLSLSPVGYMGHITSPIMKHGAFLEPLVGTFSQIFRMHDFMPHSTLFSSVGNLLCGDVSVLKPLCTNSLFAICGFNQNNINETLLPVILGHTPSGSSVKQFLHYAQEINSGYFRKFDYGYQKNQVLYGSSDPPNYNLSNINAPVYIFYSVNDWMAEPGDVMHLYNELPKISQKGKFLIPDPNFNHIDFVFGINAPKMVYEDVLKIMKKHNTLSKF